MPRASGEMAGHAGSAVIVPEIHTSREPSDAGNGLNGLNGNGNGGGGTGGTGLRSGT